MLLFQKIWKRILPSARRESDAILRIRQEIIVEAADENAVRIGFKKHAGSIGLNVMVTAASEGDARTIIRKYAVDVSGASRNNLYPRQPHPRQLRHTSNVT